MNLKSGHIDQFESYSQFASLKEFNCHMEMWLDEYKSHFSKGEIVGLKRLVRYSAKIPGVCNAKIATMLKAIHEEYKGNGISRSTFKRMIGKASKLGIFTVYETERKNGSQSSNLYVFNRFPMNEPPKQEKMNPLNKTSNPSKTNQNHINQRKETPLDYTYTSDHVPASFVDFVRCFFPEAATIEEYWRMTKIAAYKHNREKDIPLVIDFAITSFKQMVNKLKTTKKLRNPVAYFYGILNNKFQELYFEELYDMGFEPRLEEEDWS